MKSLDVLIQAIDKATREGVYTLEETAKILESIKEIGKVVQEHNASNEAKKPSLEPVTKED